MFNKLKQFKDMKNQAQILQAALAEEKVEVDRDGIKLIMDGNQKVLSISIVQELNKEELESKLPAIFNEAVGKVQQVIAQKMQSSGFSLPGM